MNLRASHGSYQNPPASAGICRTFRSSAQVCSGCSYPQGLYPCRRRTAGALPRDQSFLQQLQAGDLFSDDRDHQGLRNPVQFRRPSEQQAPQSCVQCGWDSGDPESSRQAPLRYRFGLRPLGEEGLLHRWRHGPHQI